MSTPERHERVSELFLDVCDLDVAARDQHLDAQCAGDAALRAEVEALLARDAGEAVLDEPIAITPPPMPERIGRYQIIECIGEGGMGSVYRARQEDPARDVAIKVIRPGLSSPRLLRRFRYEVQILGQLQHPGIAQVFDAGTVDDAQGSRPFFAMELIDGVALDQFLTRESLDIRRRVKLLATICDAVHHAHQKGVIHRDLKPANILVTAEGMPKVLDFGVARATDADVRATVETGVGQLIGTLPYMSPEQVLGDSEGIDIRSDVYALGVIAFEMLGGQLPIDVNQTSIVEAARAIREDRPLRLGSTNKTLRGDLDTILSVTLEKDPARRYGSAAALADDLRRWLDHAPILARPASAAYHTRLFVRRHRVAVAAAALAMVVMIVATVVSVSSAARATHQQHIAERINDYLERMLLTPNAHNMGSEVTVLELADRVVADLDGTPDELPEVEATVRGALAQSYLSNHRFDQAIAQAERATMVWRTLGTGQPRQGVSLRTAGLALYQTGRFAEAVTALREARQLLVDPSQPESLIAIDMDRAIAVALSRAGAFDEAEALLESVLVRQRGASSDPLAIVVTMRSLAYVLTQNGEWDRAGDLLIEVINAVDGVVAEHDPLLLSSIERLGIVRQRQQRLEDARELLERAWLIARTQRTAGTLDWMSATNHVLVIQQAVGDHAAQINTVLDIATRLEAELGAEDYRTRESWGHAARLYEGGGDPERAAQIRAEHATTLLRPGARHAESRE